jgi:DNA adenine methylase
MLLATGRKYRKLFKTHGGKDYVAKHIIPLIPPHHRYVEAYCGRASVLLRKRPSAIEIANDLNRELINVYLMLQQHPAEFIRRIRQRSYNERTFKQALHFQPGSDPIESAVQYVVKNRFSRGGLGRDFAWSDRLRGGQPGDVNSWTGFLTDLPRLADRLKLVRFECREALDVIQEYDDITTFTYLDPPYLPSTRSARRGVFDHDMTEADHQRLLVAITRCRGKIAVSGYSSALYSKALAGWRKIQFDLPNHSGQGQVKARRTEILWLNY